VSWNDDKEQLKQNLIDLYRIVDETPNRYEAGLAFTRQFNRLVSLVLPDDETVARMITSIDFEFINDYLEAMSDLTGSDI